MRVVVADTGPLNYLVLIAEVNILPALFGTLFVPDAVRDELAHPESPTVVREWIIAPPQWRVVRPGAEEAVVGLEPLDRGEREAISLGLSLGADLTLMDDRAGVAIARRMGLAVTGTIGLLDLAARRGLVDLADTFERLRKTSFRYRSDLLEAILAKHEGQR